MSRRQWGYLGVMVLLIVIGAIALLTPPKSAGSPPTGSVVVAEESTVDLVGTWKTEGMTATVTDSTIEILWSTEDISGLYWKGTFTATVKDGARIFSAGDVDVMSDALFASQDADKEFTFKDGKISFKRTMMNVVQTVHMTRSS